MALTIACAAPTSWLFKRQLKSQVGVSLATTVATARAARCCPAHQNRQQTQQVDRCSMQLRNGTVVGHGLMPAQAKAPFEEGARLVFSKWTALNLAVENQWGGQFSQDKAQQLLDDTIHWFYRRKDDLEVELDDAIANDFNVEAEDGSPYEVAKAMVKLYEECCRGDATYLNLLRASCASGASASQRQAGVAGMDEDDDDETSSSGDDEDGDDAMMDTDGAAAPAAVALQQQQQQAQQQRAPPEPVIDEDGFQLVQGRKKGGRR